MLRWMLLPLLAAFVAALGVSPAAADCKADLVASQKAIEATRAAWEGAEAGKCDAHRKHYTAMLKFREVLGRCDTSANRDARMAQLTASIGDFKNKAPKGCKV